MSSRGDMHTRESRGARAKSLHLVLNFARGAKNEYGCLTCPRWGGLFYFVYLVLCVLHMVLCIEVKLGKLAPLALAPPSRCYISTLTLSPARDAI
jgi:hypothetical protein